MSYLKIHRNQQGEYYIVQKNFGQDPQKDESNSHWTWHITVRGIKHLTTGPFGKPQKMPLFINADQLAELKSYDMLRRSDGSLVDRNPIYPSDALKKQMDQPAQPTTFTRKAPAKPITRPVRPAAQPQKAARPQPKRSSGFWSWLKSLFGPN